MTYFDTALSFDPFSLAKQDKDRFLSDALLDLTRHHLEKCETYQKIVHGLGIDIQKVSHYEDLPFLPVSLFKDMMLRSVPDDEVFKTMTSSGTTGQKVSKIYLDKDGASKQQKALVKIVTHFTGASRLPMLIIDSPSVVKDRAMFSARGAGILGFSIFGANRTYALDEAMEIDFPAIQAFLERHQGKKILLYGFTFMVWQHFYKKLLHSDSKLDLSNAILIHGGGWKKLSNEAVSPMDFKNRFTSLCGIQHIHDYYGMVEQTGCIYMQCEYGHLHASIFSDVIIRNAKDFSICPNNEKGIVEVVSILPKSYPGHVLLTEDEGEILGIDDCPCGRKGKYFKIHGRIKNAEIRGCSDTYEQR